MTLGFALYLSFLSIFKSPSISLALQLHLSCSIIHLFLCLGWLLCRPSVALQNPANSSNSSLTSLHLISHISFVHHSSQEDGKTKSVSCLLVLVCTLVSPSFLLLLCVHTELQPGFWLRMFTIWLMFTVWLLGHILACSISQHSHAIGNIEDRDRNKEITLL